jgi:hypothetical protein
LIFSWFFFFVCQSNTNFLYKTKNALNERRYWSW